MKINLIVIHTADVPNGRETSAEDIHRWHLEKGWDGIGYHYVIKLDGTVDNGRPEYWTGAHVKGFNKGSLGICLVGGDRFTRKQWNTLADLVRDLRLKYPDAKVIGHNERSYKTCPNFDVQKWLKSGMLPQTEVWT